MLRLAALLFFSLICSAGWAGDAARTQYPIVLVHGFIGWGRDEFGVGGTRLYYWGHCSGDLEAVMKSRGFDVYTASVSPLGSAWDRACELYAQIKGGTYVAGQGTKDDVNYVPTSGFYVDYGARHALGVTNRAASSLTEYVSSEGRVVNRGTHSRFGNSHLAPQYGMKNSNGEYFVVKHPNFPIEPIHLVVHSYGGQTARVFMEIMKNGSPNGNEGNTIAQSPYFAGGKTKFVRSLTTIATPHNGTDLTFVADDLFPTMGDLLGYFIGDKELDLVETISNQTITDQIAWFYDVDLKQWPYTLPFESIDIQPVGGQMLYLDADGNLIPELQPTIKDISLWDLSPAGSKEINKWCPSSHFASETYYFTYNCEQTFISNGGTVGKKGWSYFENPTRSLTWNIVSGTDHGGSMCPLTSLITDAMGSGTYTTGLSVTKKSLAMIPTTPGVTGYVPAYLVNIVSSELDVSPKPCVILNDYFGNSQDLSEGWKFATDLNTGVTQETKLRNKLIALFNKKGVASASYTPYLDNIMSYGALMMDLTSAWREKDGVVNSISSIAPWGEYFVDGSQSSPFITPHPTPDYAPQTGKWQYLDFMHADHFDIIGGQDFDPGHEKVWGDHTGSKSSQVDIFDFYEQHFLRLWRLPSF